MKLWLDKLSTTFFNTLTMLWIWIIGMQWISFTESIWLSETTAIVIAAITITAVIEALLPLHRGYRLALQFILIVYSVFKLLEAGGQAVPSFGRDTVLSEEVLHLFPYLWFALAAWAIFVFILVWAKTKRRILFVIGMNVIGLAVLDSFTKITLWDETAWVAGAGMGWLVTSHFNRFRRRFPQGWANLSRAPFKIIANILVIFSLIIVAGINMPHINPTLTDPYTAWREWNGVPLSGIGSSGTGSLIELSGESMSGYGRDDNDLGGGFNFDYSPVMSVSTDERSYWRGETRAVYSGTGWADRSSRRSGSDVGIEENLPDGESSSLQAQPVRQTVTMLNDNAYPVLFGAYKIREIQSLDEDIDPDRLRWVADGAELHLEGERDADYPKSYSLVSEVPVIPLDELRTRTYNELYGGSVDEAYIQKPRNFPDRVVDLAEDITESADTPYEKVVLLQQYLQSNYTYTNTPDLSRRQSEDFVDSFLFEVREGYCDYFSTAMVMMTRSLDIPARWVKGYAPGASSASEYIPMDGRIPEETGTYTVTNADAHSWVEVYFGDYGWIPIEATPGFSMPVLTAEPETEPVIEEEETEEETEEAQNTPAAASGESSSGGWVKGVGIAAAVVIAFWIVYILWRMRINLRFAGARIRAGKPLTAADKVIAETERWLRSVHRRGLVRQEHETLRESVRRWSESQPSLAPQLKPLLQQFEAARYSPAEVLEEQWRDVQAEAMKLKKTIRKVRLT